MDYTWTVREATIDDSEAISQLYREVYQDDRLPGSLWEGDVRSWWQWWMLDNNTGISHSYIAEDKGRIIAHYATLLHWFNFFGEKKLASYGWGAMVHPDYQRQGIMRTIRGNIKNLIIEDRIVLTFGCATELGRITYTSFGGITLGRQSSLVKILNTQNVLSKKTNSSLFTAILGPPFNLALRLPAIRKIGKQGIKPGNIVEINRFDERFDNFWMKIKENIVISVWKDSEYLNWRYIDRPGVKYLVLAVENDGDVYGFIVLRFVDAKYRIGYIVDLLSLSGEEDYALHLIDSSVDCLREGGADIAICQVFKHNPCYRLLTDNGFFRKGQGGMWTFATFSGDSTHDLADVRNWFLMHGDSDLM